MSGPSERLGRSRPLILRTLARKSIFPNLKQIVVAGHSAGGQFAGRYAMANKVHDTLGVPVSYVVANPSSYAWPVAERPLPQGGAEAQGPTRRARGEAFVKYVDEVLGAKHKIVIVPECGHNDRCIFTTGIVFPYVFPGAAETK